jgi:hypothetical protein
MTTRTRNRKMSKEKPKGSVQKPKGAGSIFRSVNADARRAVVNLHHPFRDKGPIPHGSTLQMKRGLSFTIFALLGLLASVAMAMDNNWSGAALGCVAAGGLLVVAIV